MERKEVEELSPSVKMISVMAETYLKKNLHTYSHRRTVRLMAKVSSQVSRFDAKSTNRDEDVVTTSLILGKKEIVIPEAAPITQHGGAKLFL